MAEVTFASSYLTEKLKLGDAGMVRTIKKQLRLDDLSAHDVGLSLSFSEDRALTAVQSLFAFQGFKPHETVSLTPQAQEVWGCTELPVMVTEVRAYCRAYTQGGDVTADAALTALKTLVGRSFYLAYTDGPESPPRCLYAPVLAVQKYKLRGVRRPTHLRIALTPVLLQGVYPAATGFRPKQTDLHAKLLVLAGAKPGRPPEQLLRLTSWLMTLPKQPTMSVTDQTLAERLRSQSLQHSQVGKFRHSLEQHFGITKQLGLIMDFKAPEVDTGGKWLIKLK